MVRADGLACIHMTSSHWSIANVRSCWRPTGGSPRGAENGVSSSSCALLADGTSRAASRVTGSRSGMTSMRTSAMAELRTSFWNTSSRQTCSSRQCPVRICQRMTMNRRAPFGRSVRLSSWVRRNSWRSNRTKSRTWLTAMVAMGGRLCYTKRHPVVLDTCRRSRVSSVRGPRPRTSACLVTTANARATSASSPTGISSTTCE